MGSNSQRYPRVNIVSTDYGRYGTSVYQRLYSRKEGENVFGADPHIRRNETFSLCKNRVVSPTVTRDENSCGSLMKTGTFGSTSSNTTTGGSEEIPTDDGQLIDNCSITDGAGDSKSSKIRRKYKSLISSSSKKFISKLHEHGSSDTFSIFSLRTTQSHKHDRLKSEQTIFESRQPPDAKFEALPVEIVANVLLMLEAEDQKNLVNCLYVSKSFYEASKMVLYRSPKFTSTYRVAQFVTSLRLHPENGNYVKILDLSQLKNGLIVEDSETGREAVESLNGFDSLAESSFDETYEYALAGWRDWRHRHDPLYGATALNSFNLKRVASRSPSISSQSSPAASSPKFNNAHAFPSTSGSWRTRAHRSNSSVSSFTSSIMSSLQNNSHVSLVTTTSTSNSADHSALEFNGKLNRRKSANGDITQNNQKSKAKDENSVRRSLWYRLKIGSKSSRLLSEKRDPKILDRGSGEDSTDGQRRNTTVKFTVSQPFRTGHPYANKFLLKYAPFRDLPIGYILHLLKLCPNITHLDLSHLIFCIDYEIITKKPSKILNNSSMLPAVQESVESTSKAETQLDVVYLTDSNKNYDYYNQVARGRTGTQVATNFFTTCGNNDDSPQLIDAQNRGRTLARHKSINGVQLRKLNPAEIFEYLCDHQLNNALQHVKMDDILWCRQNMIKYLIMKSFEKKDSKDIRFSFARAGLNRNLAWTCNGQLNDFVSLLVMDHIHQMDEVSLKELFNVLSKPSFDEEGPFPDPEIIEISKVFALQYGLSAHQQEELDFRVTIIRSERPTSYRIRHLSRSHISLVVDLCDQEEITDPSTMLDSISESSKRIHQLGYEITSKIRELRNAELRSNLGENNFIMENLVGRTRVLL